jgi:hypothetical protein
LPTSDEEKTVGRLRYRLDQCQRELRTLNDYYEGQQKLVQLGLAVPPALQGLVTLINWPRIAVDTVEHRLDVEGFRLPDSELADRRLWEVWQANGLDEESQLAHVDALALSRSYVAVSSPDPSRGEGPFPLVTVESCLEMAHESDPRTRGMTAALKVTRDQESLARVAETTETLYLRDSTIWYQSVPGSPRKVVNRDDHNLGRPPVVALVNRARVADRKGVSEMRDVLPLTDAACRALTNAQVATEVLAVPTRWAAGIQASDFKDPATGAAVDTWKTYYAAIMATANGDAKFGQFDAANLGNFDVIVNLYAHLVSAVTGIPVRFFGVNSANPPSAEGIRADESRLVKNAERKQRSFGGPWESAMRLVLRFMDGEWDPQLANMETLWRDPATPTQAQAADAIVKLTQGDRPIYPREYAWEKLGESAAARTRLKEMFAEQDAAPEDPTFAAIARGLTGAGVRTPNEPVTPDAAAAVGG